MSPGPPIERLGFFTGFSRDIPGGTTEAYLERDKLSGSYSVRWTCSWCAGESFSLTFDGKTSARDYFRLAFRREVEAGREPLLWISRKF